MKTREIAIAALPQGPLTPEHFALRETELPDPGPGEVLLRTILISIDAAARAWMQGATYRAPVRAGDAMPCYALCEVVESRSATLSPGNLVVGETVWCDHAVQPAAGLQKVPDVRPLTHLMSVYGIAGKTAFHGLIGVGRPIAGETVLVSAAAGAVGCYVGQIAKAMGCRVVGIAGGPEKCAFVTDTLGFDACIDYRDPGMHKALRAACPDGVDIYFDNVGGAVLEAALFAMNDRGRVVCCGAVSQYDTASARGPRNLPGLVVVKRLRMEGFIVTDFADQDAPAQRALQHWVGNGQIKVIEDVIDGLENAPAALIGLLAGQNRGKRMVRVGPDPDATRQ
ncbi:MAG: NADP-dependent oxidoreductase [Pseudodonghicola sp.]